MTQNETARGLVHIYCGDGKGKTSCAAGLALRAAHYRHEAGYYLQIGRWLPHA